MNRNTVIEDNTLNIALGNSYDTQHLYLAKQYPAAVLEPLKTSNITALS